jgi:hypothetical protein
MHLYSDDTVVYTIASTVDQALFELQSSFTVLQKTCIDMKLVMNAGKTVVL